MDLSEQYELSRDYELQRIRNEIRNNWSHWRAQIEAQGAQYLVWRAGWGPEFAFSRAEMLALLPRDKMAIVVNGRGKFLKV